MKQNVKRENGRVVGAKTFSYYLIPKEPGDYDLGEYFRWVFFNPKTNRYDTLKSNYSVSVTGESQRNQVIENKDQGSFYDRIAVADNTLHSSMDGNWLKIGANLFILLMLGASVFLVFKK